MINTEKIETLSLVAKYTTNLVLITDPFGNITWVNNAFITKMKYPVNEILNRKPSSFLHGSSTNLNSSNRIKAAIKNQEPFREEIIHYTKDQEPIWILADGQPILSDNNKIVKYIIVETDISEQKKQQNILDRTESFLHYFFNSSGSILILFGTSLEITIFNNQAFNFVKDKFSFRLEVSKSILDFFSGIGFEFFGKFALDTLQGQGIENLEIQILKDKIWWNIRFLTIYDSYNKIIGGSFTAIDITVRKNAEVIVKQNEERFNLVSKATFDAIWDWDIEKNTLFRGDGYYKNFGYTIDNLKNDTSIWDKLVHPDDYERVILNFQTTLDSKLNQWNAEYLFLKADGTYANVRDKAIIIRDEKGIAKRMVGAMQDITKQVKKEQELLLLSSVITNSKDAILITESYNPISDTMRIIYVNEAFTNMTGFSFHEIIGRSPYFLHGPLSDKTEIEKLNKSITLIQACEVELIHYKKNGDKYWAQISFVPVFNEKSEITHWISIQKDITERRNEMEERDVMIQELIKSNNEMKQFSYITSHNLRGPLTNMTGILRLIEKIPNSDEQFLNLIDGLKKSTINLTDTLNDLIKILIVKENTTLLIENINLELKLLKVIESIQNLINESDTHIEYDFSAVHIVQFNRAYLQSIFLNLITNAIRFKKIGQPLKIKISSIVSNGSVKLYISDNGQGMDWNKVKNKIFGLYQKFHRNSDSKGIGLFLVHAQITSLGGTIEVETELDKGTTFILTFKQSEN